MQLRRLFFQQNAVRREGEVIDARQLGQHFHESRESGADERFATRETQPVNAHLRNDAHKPRDLLERENLLARAELHVLIRHAVKAANVATIGDTDPQAGVRAAECVDEGRCVGDLSHARWQRRSRGQTRRHGEGETRRFDRTLLLNLLVSLSACLPLFVQSWVYPLSRPVRPLFTFPNRHVVLERIDQPLAGGEGVAAVRRADDDRHAGLESAVPRPAGAR